MRVTTGADRTHAREAKVWVYVCSMYMSLVYTCVCRCVIMESMISGAGVLRSLL